MKKCGTQSTRTTLFHATIEASIFQTQLANSPIAVPLFAPVMFNNLYSNVTEKLYPTFDPVTGLYVGVGNYWGDIWGATELDSGGILQSLFPYSQNSGGWSSFGYYISYGKTGELQNAINQIYIYSQGMQYVNFLEWLKQENFLCSNINVQINCKSSTANFNQKIGFFQQEVNGKMFSIETNPIDWINPQTNWTRPVSGVLNANFDIKTDWVLKKNSGICFYLTPELNTVNGDRYNLNFTLQQIIK